MSRIVHGTMCLLLAFAALPASAQPAEPATRAEPPEPATRPAARTVGTIVFPPRADVQRVSSALELLAVEVPNPQAGPAAAKRTTNAREMAARALDFLRRSQQADGSWGDKQWPQNAGVTALCCLALFAEGNLPRVGPSGRELALGLEFLLSCCKDDGQIAGRDVYRFGPMYDHSWATLCLLMSYGNMPWRRDMREKTSRAIQILLKYQKPDGGWRYKMMREGDSDTLVTVNVLYALSLAERAGFAVPRAAVERAVAFVGRRAAKDGLQYTGRWEYRAGGDLGSTAVSACGAIALRMTAADEQALADPRIEATQKFLADFHQRYTPADLLAEPYVHYGAFYVSQAMYAAGERYWAPYYRKMLEVFAASQRAEGQFLDQNGNSVYPTAAAAIVLQAPLGYLPLYLR